MLKNKLLVALLMTAGSLFGYQIGIGISIGAPPRPRVERVQPRRPGPDYIWVEGYWYPVGGHYRWHSGYWTRPAYEGAHWIGPRYDHGHFFEGYWDGAHGRVDHDHRWDRGHDRDFHHDHH